MDNAADHEQVAVKMSQQSTKLRVRKKENINDGYQMPTKFDITTKNTGVHRGPQLHQASAQLLNKLLKENQINNHVFLSDEGGFHNHHAHHLLSAYALGATPQELQLAYNTMDDLQRPRFPVNESTVREMYDAKSFRSMLGDDSQYHNYLAFFWQKFEKQGWKEVVNEYLFSGSEIAEQLFVRLFAGIWHNLILLGYGIEFAQPGIVAEALAGACVHSEAFESYLMESEKLAKNSRGPCKPLVELLQEIRNNPTLCDEDHWGGGKPWAYDDDVFSNAPPGMARLASQWKVEEPEELLYRTVELINVNAFIAGAAQRPNKTVKIDFVFVHQINASIFFSAFHEQDWMTQATKTRLLEWYARICLLFYAASLGPKLPANEIVNYKPLKPGSTWSSIIQRCLVVPDDGHLPKLIRALAHGEAISQPWEGSDAKKEMPQLPVKGSMWLQIANMGIDSTETEPDILRRWVMGTGSDASWAKFADRRD